MRISLKLFTLISMILLLASGDADGRAGGGGGYGGGGGFGGGGSSFGGGDGDGRLIGELIFYVVRFLVWLVVNHPMIGIPAVLILAFLAYKFFLSGDTVWRGLPDLPRAAVPATPSGLHGLKERDPKFDEESFRSRVESAFLLIQSAWSSRQLSRVKHLVSDGVFERFDILLKMHQARGFRNECQGFNVSSVVVEHVKSVDRFDIIQVRVEASSLDYYVADTTGAVVAGSRTHRQSFAEYWSFIRRRGVTSVKGKGLIEGHCPNCAAPIQLTDRGTCQHCQALVASGEYDWILSEITQTAAGFSISHLPEAYSELVQKDQDFNEQYIEDRVSVMFWRLRAAEMLADRSLIHNLASEDFLRKNWKAPQADGKRSFIVDPAIGSVELFGITLADQADTPDRLSVRIKWSGRKLSAKLPTLIPPEYDKVELFDQTFILSRQSSTKTRPEQGLSSNHCENCGAPETRDDTGRCAYCGSVRNDGSVAWVLEAVEPFRGYESRRPRHHVAAARGSDIDDVILTAARLFLADGILHDLEYQMLLDFCLARRVGERHMRILINQAREGKISQVRLLTKEHKRNFLKTIIMFAKADGVVTAEEERFIQALHAELKLSTKELQSLLA